MLLCVRLARAAGAAPFAQKSVARGTAQNSKKANSAVFEIGRGLAWGAESLGGGESGGEGGKREGALSAAPPSVRVGGVPKFCTTR